MLPSIKPSKGVNPVPNFVPTWNNIQSGFKKYSRPPPRKNNRAKKSSSPGTATLHELAQKAKNDDLRDPGFDDNYGIGAVVPNEQQPERGNSGARKERERENRMLRNKILGKRNKTAENGKDWKRVRREESSDEEEGRSGLGRAKKRQREAVVVVEQKDTGDDKNGDEKDNNERNGEKDDMPMEEAQTGSKQEVDADKSLNSSNEEGATAAAAEDEPGQEKGDTTLAEDDDEWNGTDDQPTEGAKLKKKRKRKKKSKSAIPS